MTRPPKHWTDEELELFHDEELGDRERAQLSGDLRRDATLRGRLSDIRRLDDELRQSLLQEPNTHAHAVRSRNLVSALSRVAACLLIAVPVIGWFLVKRGPTETGHVTHLVPTDGEGVDGEYLPIRVVLSLSVAERQDPEPTAVPSPGTSIEPGTQVAMSPSDDRRFLGRIDELLRFGRTHDAVDLLQGASMAQRRVAYHRIGELLQSAYVAEQILDQLGPREQLVVCAQWAGESSLRSTVFARLVRFSKEPEWSDTVYTLVSNLEEDPTLRSWVRSFQLASGDSSARRTPS